MRSPWHPCRRLWIGLVGLDSFEDEHDRSGERKEDSNGSSLTLRAAPTLALVGIATFLKKSYLKISKRGGNKEGECFLHSLADYIESYISFLLFLLFWGFNHHHEPCYRHGDISFYHNMSTKISPPRMTGKLPASGHWHFRGTMTPSRSEQAAPLEAVHPAPTSGTDTHPLSNISISSRKAQNSQHKTYDVLLW